ncbi:MAG: hypothetical protein E6J90_51160 [Deltaproteobacteria bacterium]|nr:MAG: hypothetical protein E6J90_51160 [Deltaproteobacteria bacterium]TMQ09117.1 MAG: hypothetical protein E6J91_31250 [Deltaproteobacteria bacterium]
MPTISRETILIDRRQPTLRWSAVFAGAVCSIGLWMLLQLLGLGLGLTAVDADNIRSLRGAGITTTVWSLIAPLVAMFFGGLLTGKLAQTYEHRLAAIHGVLMWSLTAVVGLCATIWIATMIAAGATRGGAAFDATGQVRSWSFDRDEAGLSSALGIDADEVLGAVNQRGKTTVTPAQLDAALRGVARAGLAKGDFDQELLVDQLLAHTRLTRAEATDVERQIEAHLDTQGGRAHELERRIEHATLGAVDTAGKALATVGFSLLLSLLAAVAGAALALHRPRRGDGGRRVRTTEPGFAAPPVDAAAVPPSPTTVPASPVIPPTDVVAP